MVEVRLRAEREALKTAVLIFGQKKEPAQCLGVLAISERQEQSEIQKAWAGLGRSVAGQRRQWWQSQLQWQELESFEGKGLQKGRTVLGNSWFAEFDVCNFEVSCANLGPVAPIFESRD